MMTTKMKTMTMIARGLYACVVASVSYRVTAASRCTVQDSVFKTDSTK